MIDKNLIVVIQNDPRDGEEVYLEKDFEAFKRRVVELDLVEADVADEVVELGQTYWNDDDSSSIIGHAVQLPYLVNNVCPECFGEGEQDSDHQVGLHMVVNFVAEAGCDICTNDCTTWEE
jgi:hypothetical protein